MRFLIIGAGALGGYYGGMLLRGGADVTFLVRPRRAAQLAERRLVIKMPDGEYSAPVKTVLSSAVGGPYDVVFVACKAYGLKAAIDDFAPALRSDGAVLPVLNGINHVAVLSERLGAARVLGGVTLFSVVLTPEGDILVPGVGKTGQTSIGELTGERSARCEQIAGAFVAGGVPATISDNIVAEMWAKFSCFAGATAVSVLDSGPCRRGCCGTRGSRLCRCGARRKCPDRDRRRLPAAGYADRPLPRLLRPEGFCRRSVDAVRYRGRTPDRGRPHLR